MDHMSKVNRTKTSGRNSLVLPDLLGVCRRKHCFCCKLVSNILIKTPSMLECLPQLACVAQTPLVSFLRLRKPIELSRTWGIRKISLGDSCHQDSQHRRQGAAFGHSVSIKRPSRNKYENADGHHRSEDDISDSPTHIILHIYDNSYTEN